MCKNASDGRCHGPHKNRQAVSWAVVLCRECRPEGAYRGPRCPPGSRRGCHNPRDDGLRHAAATWHPVAFGLSEAAKPSPAAAITTQVVKIDNSAILRMSFFHVLFLWVSVCLFPTIRRSSITGSPPLSDPLRKPICCRDG